jgi:hypothetical protein
LLGEIEKNHGNISQNVWPSDKEITSESEVGFGSQILFVSLFISDVSFDSVSISDYIAWN